jgi:hypothetical protein
VAHRVISRRRNNSVAFGAKRTFSDPRLQNRIYEYAPLKAIAARWEKPDTVTEASHDTQPNRDETMSQNTEEPTTDLDRIKVELMDLLPKAGNAPENARIGELFKAAKKLVYANAGPKPTDRRRIKAWEARREKAWDSFCGGREGFWRWPDGKVMVMSPRIAAGFIKRA